MQKFSQLIACAYVPLLLVLSSVLSSVHFLFVCSWKTADAAGFSERTKTFLKAADAAGLSEKLKHS